MCIIYALDATPTPDSDRVHGNAFSSAAATVKIYLGALCMAFIVRTASEMTGNRMRERG